jgi:ketosteroid isomerase-like protein
MTSATRQEEERMPIRATLFADIDSMEPDRFAAHLADDVVFRFGNADPIQGRDAVRDAWAGFCETLDGVRHDGMEQWEQDGTTIAAAEVTYTRKDGSRVTVPVATIYRGDDEIEDYRIFIDLAPLFAD